jgi:hypothetical protein
MECVICAPWPPLTGIPVSDNVYYVNFRYRFGPAPRVSRRPVMDWRSALCSSSLARRPHAPRLPVFSSREGCWRAAGRAPTSHQRARSTGVPADPFAEGVLSGIRLRHHTARPTGLENGAVAAPSAERSQGRGRRCGELEAPHGWERCRGIRKKACQRCRASAFQGCVAPGPRAL